MYTEAECQGKCPKCGSEKLNYGMSKLDGETVIYSFTCDDCDTTAEEVYALEYIYTGFEEE